MDFSSVFWIVIFVVSAVLLFSQVYAIILISDLESDWINPVDLCKSLNPYVLPEFVIHGTLTVFFLLMRDVFPLLVSLPLDAYHAWCFKERWHRYDATEVFQRLPEHKRRAIVKLVYYLVVFFYFMYRMIYALVSLALIVGWLLILNQYVLVVDN